MYDESEEERESIEEILNELDAEELRHLLLKLSKNIDVRNMIRLASRRKVSDSLLASILLDFEFYPEDPYGWRAEDEAYSFSFDSAVKMDEILDGLISSGHYEEVLELSFQIPLTVEKSISEFMDPLSSSHWKCSSSYWIRLKPLMSPSYVFGKVIAFLKDHIDILSADSVTESLVELCDNDEERNILLELSDGYYVRYFDGCIDFTQPGEIKVFKLKLLDSMAGRHDEWEKLIRENSTDSAVLNYVYAREKDRSSDEELLEIIRYMMPMNRRLHFDFDLPSEYVSLLRKTGKDEELNRELSRQLLSGCNGYLDIYRELKDRLSSDVMEALCLQILNDSQYSYIAPDVMNEEKLYGKLFSFIEKHPSLDSMVKYGEGLMSFNKDRFICLFMKLTYEYAVQTRDNHGYERVVSYLVYLRKYAPLETSAVANDIGNDCWRKRNLRKAILDNGFTITRDK